MKVIKVVDGGQRFDGWMRALGAGAIVFAVSGLLMGQAAFGGGTKAKAGQVTCDSNGELLAISAFDPNEILVLGHSSNNVYVYPTGSTATHGAVVGGGSGAHSTIFNTKQGNSAWSCQRVGGSDVTISIIGIK